MKFKKQNLVVLLVIVALISLALVAVMIGTKNETKAATTNHVCHLCNGTGRCQSSPEITGQGFDAYCPNCKKNIATWTIWYCTTCKYGRETVYCPTCKYDSTGGDINTHDRQLCPACAGLGVCRGTYEYTPNTTNTHTMYCETCGDTAEESCTKEVEYIDSRYHGDVCTKCKQETNKERHSGGTHSNNGECRECGEIYQDHEMSARPTGYTNMSTSYHTPVYTCDCGETELGDREAHTDRDGDGNCDVCEYQITTPHTHTAKSTWESNSHSHWKICSDTTCREEISGTRQEHLGGTHNNGGKCTVCNYKYQTHTLGTTATGYTDITSTTHTPVYTCSCGSTEKKLPQTHKDNNGDGKCDLCSYQITVPHTHTPKTTWEADENKHWKICSDPACGEKISGTESVHQVSNWTNKEDGTHSGRCTTCNRTIVKAHNYENGICKDCGALQEVPTCNHVWKVESDKTNHWEECTKCHEKKNVEKHNYINGVCGCGSKEETTACEHIWTVKNDATNHWEECTKCHEKKNVEKHNYINGVCGCGSKEQVTTCEHDWKVKSNETNHWEECTKCHEKKNVEKHNYVNGICGCGSKEQENKCEHKNKEWKSDSKEHWQVCKDCGKEIEGTRGKHANENGACKNCGLKDGTTGTQKLPFTGNKSITIMIVMLAMITVVTAVRLKKHENE